MGAIQAMASICSTKTIWNAQEHRRLYRPNAIDRKITTLMEKIISWISKENTAALIVLKNTFSQCWNWDSDTLFPQGNRLSYRFHLCLISDHLENIRNVNSHAVVNPNVNLHHFKTSKNFKCSREFQHKMSKKTSLFVRSSDKMILNTRARSMWAV